MNCPPPWGPPPTAAINLITPAPTTPVDGVSYGAPARAAFAIGMTTSNDIVLFRGLK